MNTFDTANVRWNPQGALISRLKDFVTGIFKWEVRNHSWKSDQKVQSPTRRDRGDDQGFFDFFLHISSAYRLFSQVYFTVGPTGKDLASLGDVDQHGFVNQHGLSRKVRM